jgi:hypothetical protein
MSFGAPMLCPHCGHPAALSAFDLIVYAYTTNTKDCLFGPRLSYCGSPAAGRTCTPDCYTCAVQKTVTPTEGAV